MRNNKESVYMVTSRILYRIEQTMETGSTKAMLARLRKSIGKNISTTVDIWEELFAQIPEGFLSKSGIPTKEENAILTTLQLFALHQQGSKDSVNVGMDEDEKDEGKDEQKTSYMENIGQSLSILRTGDDCRAIDRRFNAMITASTYKELIVHLRHLISIYKNKSNAKIDYAKLAQDLFWFQLNYKERIRLTWGQSYYWRKPIIEEEK